MAVIEVENLKYRYPRTTGLALSEITFSVESGEFIGVIGANGAGKSTLLAALSGLVPNFYKGTYAGLVQVAGLHMGKADLTDVASKVGVIFQNPFTQMTGAKSTVFDEIAFGLENLGIPREEMLDRIEKVMVEIGIWKLRDKSPFALSGGQMQRVAIASVLVMEPEVVLLDEPTSQLDPQASSAVFEIVSRLKESGKTVVLAEQKMEMVAQYSDRILVMSQGQVLDFDRPETVFSMDNLSDLGIDRPIFTQLAKNLGLKNPDGIYPVTLDQFKKGLR